MTHFVARVVIEKVVIETTRGTTSNSEIKRGGVEEYLSITVKAETIEALKSKIHGHVELVE